MSEARGAVSPGLRSPERSAGATKEGDTSKRLAASRTKVKTTAGHHRGNRRLCRGRQRPRCAHHTHRDRLDHRPARGHRQRPRRSAAHGRAALAGRAPCRFHGPRRWPDRHASARPGLPARPAARRGRPLGGQDGRGHQAPACRLLASSGMRDGGSCRVALSRTLLKQRSRRRPAANSPFHQELPEPEVEAFRAAVIIVGWNDQILVVPAHDRRGPGAAHVQVGRPLTSWHWDHAAAGPGQPMRFTVRRKTVRPQRSRRGPASARRRRCWGRPVLGLDRAADQLAGRVNVMTRADHEPCSVGQDVSDVAGRHPGGRGAEGPRPLLRLEGNQGRFSGARRTGGDEDRERGLVPAARAA